MDHQSMGGRPCTISLEGCQHSHHLEKGDRTECGNYRGISLLSAAGKIFARILLNRLSKTNKQSHTKYRQNLHYVHARHKHTTSA